MFTTIFGFCNHQKKEYLNPQIDTLISPLTVQHLIFQEQTLLLQKLNSHWLLIIIDSQIKNNSSYQ